MQKAESLAFLFCFIRLVTAAARSSCLALGYLYAGEDAVAGVFAFAEC